MPRLAAGSPAAVALCLPLPPQRRGAAAPGAGRGAQAHRALAAVRVQKRRAVRRAAAHPQVRHAGAGWQRLGAGVGPWVRPGGCLHTCARRVEAGVRMTVRCSRHPPCLSCMTNSFAWQRGFACLAAARTGHSRGFIRLSKTRPPALPQDEQLPVWAGAARGGRAHRPPLVQQAARGAAVQVGGRAGGREAVPARPCSLVHLTRLPVRLGAVRGGGVVAGAAASGALPAAS